MPYKKIYVESGSDNDSDTTIEPENEDTTQNNKKLIKNKLNQESEQEITSPVKKRNRVGRPEKSLEEKLAKKTIIKEKIIYMIPDENGGFKEQKNKALTSRDIKRIEDKKKVEEMEKELGKKLIQKKNGKVDKRSIGMKTRTPAQIEATKKMLEANKKRRAAEKELKDVKKTTKNKEIVKEALEEVIYKPSKKPEPKPPSPYDNLKF